eukprot:10563704-Heterocapsa_arctica.AAC.1
MAGAKAKLQLCCILDASVVKLCVSHWRELGFEAVILKRVILSNPKYGWRHGETTIFMWC